MTLSNGVNGARVPRVVRDASRELFDPALERAFLGSALYHPEILLASEIVESDFYSGAHARTFAAMLALLAEGEPVNTVSLVSKLHERGHLVAVGGETFVLDLTNVMPERDGPWLRIRKLAARRTAQELARLVAGKAGDDEEFARYFDQLVAARAKLESICATDARAATPTFAEPLSGLRHLGPLAVLGRDRILELAKASPLYAWQDIAVVGTVVLIAGGPSEGKTTLLFLLLAARANTGGPVKLLNRHVAPAPASKFIVVIESEHSESSTAIKLRRSLDLLEIDDAALNRVMIVARKQVHIGSPEWADLLEMIKAGIVSDLAVDTLARFAPADANDEREQVRIFHLLAAAIEAAPDGTDKPTIWLVAHTKKSADGSVGDVSGSTQRTGQADTVMLVKGTKAGGRTVSSRVTFAKLREDPDEYPTPIDFAIEREADGTTRLTTNGASNDDRPLTARIIDQLSGRGRLTKNQLIMALGRNGADIERALTTLFAGGALRSCTVTVRGVERKGFELHSSPDVSPEEGL